MRKVFPVLQEPPSVTLPAKTETGSTAPSARASSETIMVVGGGREKRGSAKRGTLRKR